MIWPTKDEITQTLVNNLVGEGKTIEDLANQWVIKHLIVGLREAIYILLVVIKAVYDQLTAVGAMDDKLDEMGYEYGVDRKQATKAIHSVTLRKSSPVAANYPIPDNFLLTTTPAGNDPPVQFRVMPAQEKHIAAGSTFVSDVLVECTEAGDIGNVIDGAINLVAQAGIDQVTDSVLVQSGQEKEENEPYRARILERKRNPERGGTAADYKAWAESVDGVVSAIVFPRNRGNGTVDIMITGPDGIPSQTLIDAVQAYINTKIPADLADGGVLVTGGTPVTIDVTITNTVWRNGYDLSNGTPIVEAAIKDYINHQANVDRAVKYIDLITIVRYAFDPVNIDKTSILINFTMAAPTADTNLGGTETAVPGTITIS